MATRPTVHVVVPPKEPGGRWFTIEVDAEYPSRQENQERRRLGLPQRTFLPPDRIAAIRAEPTHQVPPTHLPANQLAVWNDCVRLLNQAVAIGGAIASRAWALFHDEDLLVQQVRWAEADCCPSGVDPMTVLLEAEAQLRDLIANHSESTTTILHEAATP